MKTCLGCEFGDAVDLLSKCFNNSHPGGLKKAGLKGPLSHFQTLPLRTVRQLLLCLRFLVLRQQDS